MNIFVLDEDPRIAAHHHCDKHVVKMIIETAQLLCTAHFVCDGAIAEGMYKPTHINHPCAIWVRERKDNYTWTYQLLCWLCEEYYRRYGKDHKTSRLCGILREFPKNISTMAGSTPFAQCVPEQYRCENAVMAYRECYKKEKYTFAKWRSGDIPDWFLA